MKLQHVVIAGTGSAVPERVVPNHEIESKLPSVSAAWVEENLGIRERRIAAEMEFTSDLAAKAGARAIEASGLSVNAIDLVIVATATPDRKAPSTAALVQQKLGMKNYCAVFDVAAVCSGFIYAMTIGAQFIEAGSYRNVLVIGADTFSKITDWTRRDCVFFGDGAGAVVLRRTEDSQALFTAQLGGDGNGADTFTVFPFDSYFTMNGKGVFETATTVLPQAIRNVLEESDLSLADVKALVPHQPSIRVLRRTAEVLGLPIERVKMNMERYANTAGATIPLLLDEVARSGQISHGDVIVFAAIGSGWTWGSAVYRWL